MLHKLKKEITDQSVDIETELNNVINGILPVNLKIVLEKLNNENTTNISILDELNKLKKYNESPDSVSYKVYGLPQIMPTDKLINLISHYLAKGYNICVNNDFGFEINKQQECTNKLSGHLYLSNSPILNAMLSDICNDDKLSSRFTKVSENEFKMEQDTLIDIESTKELRQSHQSLFGCMLGNIPSLDEKRKVIKAQRLLEEMNKKKEIINNINVFLNTGTSDCYADTKTIESFSFEELEPIVQKLIEVGYIVEIYATMFCIKLPDALNPEHKKTNLFIKAHAIKDKFIEAGYNVSSRF